MVYLVYMYHSLSLKTTITVGKTYQFPWMVWVSHSSGTQLLRVPWMGVKTRPVGFFGLQVVGCSRSWNPFWSSRWLKDTYPDAPLYGIFTLHLPYIYDKSRWRYMDPMGYIPPETQKWWVLQNGILQSAASMVANLGKFQGIFLMQKTVTTTA